MQPQYPPPPVPSPRRGIPRWAWALILGGGCVVFVIPAIAILAAILFPVFAQARQKARQTTCMANLKQMGLAAQMYAQDYNGKLPRGVNWMDATSTYVKDRENVYRCPGAPRSGAGHGYAFDSRLSGKVVTKRQAPERTMLLYDSSNLSRNASDPGTSLPLDPPRHVGGNNVGYTDGHVRWLRASPAPRPREEGSQEGRNRGTRFPRPVTGEGR